MDPTLFPFAGGGVPFLGGTLGAGDIPQQPAQAPMAPPRSPGFFGGLRNMIQGGGGATQTVGPDFGSAGGAGLYPFITQRQGPPQAGGGFGANPLKAQPEQTELPPNATSTVGKTEQTTQQKTGNSLMDALRGVKAPAPPQAQTVRTPPPPQLAPIKGGEFVSMLSSLGITPQEFIKMRMGGLGGR